jgi:hypothetical protein
MAPYSPIRTADKIFFSARKAFGDGCPLARWPQVRSASTARSSGPTRQHPDDIGAADPAATRVYWAYKSTLNDGQFDKVLCMTTRWIARRSLPRAASTCLARPARLTLESLDSISGSIDALPFSLDDVSTAALSKLSAVSTAHKLGFFTGGNLEATLDTAEQTLGRRVRVKGLRPVTDAAACYGSVGARENLQSGVSYSAEQGVNAKGLCPANVSTRVARGRLRIPASASWTFASGVEPDFAPEGKR